MRAHILDFLTWAQKKRNVRIVIHAGANKTGSTAIQNACAEHRKTLAKAGIFYPSVGSATNHNMLLPAILDDEEFRGNLNRSNAEGRAASIVKSEELWTQFAEDLTNNECDTVLLSSEFVLGLRPNSFERLLKRLRAFSNDFHAVVYVRDPCDHYLSSAQQILKYGAAVKDPRNVQNFAQKIRMTEKYLPGRVTLRVFSRDKLHRGDITLDFLKVALGEKRSANVNVVPMVSNTSLSAEGMALLRKFNRVVWGNRRVVGSAVNKELLKAISEEEEKGSYNKPKLLPDIREVVMRCNIEDVRRLRDDYGVVFEKFDYDVVSLTEFSVEEDARLSNLEVSDIVECDPDLVEHLTFRVMAKYLRAAAR